MISKHLTIAAAFVLLTSFGVGPALAQNTGGATAPAATTAAPAAPAPAVAAPIVKAPTVAANQENPYGLNDIIKKKNPVSYTVLGILLVMSVGTWYIFFTKYLDQSRILNQARIVEHDQRGHREAAEDVHVPRHRRSRRSSVRGRHQSGQSQRLDRHVAGAPA
jgi:biopolymer transport protein ExbB